MIACVAVIGQNEISYLEKMFLRFRTMGFLTVDDLFEQCFEI